MRKFITLMFLVAFSSWYSFGQVVSNYSFAATSGTYTAVTTGTQILPLSGSTSFDDNRVMAPFGFNFQVGGVNYTQACVSANGYLHFDVDKTLGYTPISSTTAAPFVVSPFGVDLISGPAGKVITITQGTAPNRVFVVQWSDVRRYGSNYVGESYNYQVKLYETSNKVELVYGHCTLPTVAPSSYSSPQVGLRGATNADFKTLTTTTTWLAATPSATNTSSTTLMCTNSVYPSEGLTYTFTPPLLTIPGVAGIVAPLNGAINVLPTTILKWSAPAVTPTASAPTGYKVYFGNTANPPLVTTTAANVLQYDPTPDMDLNTTYHWKIVPTNAAGDATGAVEWSFTTTAGFGSITGVVKSPNLTPIEGAAVKATSSDGQYIFNSAPTGANGVYSFTPAGQIPAGTYTLTAGAATYNITTVSNVVVTPSNTTNQDIVMLQPTMTITQNPYNAVVNPNELYNGQLNIANGGTGTLNWSVAASGWSSSNHDWLTIPTTSGSVNPGNNVNLSLVFDATGLEAGTTESATLTFTPVPNIGAVEVLVTMVVTGDALVPVTNVNAVVTNQLTGTLGLSWDCVPSAGFQYYAITLDGTQVHVQTTGTNWATTLPSYGTYTYCVSAVYANGATAPACDDVEWANPTLTFSPQQGLFQKVFVGESTYVQEDKLHIGNIGQGTMSYSVMAAGSAAGGSLLTYCAAGANTTDEYISNVSFGTINNSSGTSSGNYKNYTNISTNALAGSTMPISVTIGNYYSSDRVDVYFDFNRDGDFADAGEYFSLSTTNPATGNITIPSSATVGPTTMRVRVRYGGTANPCGNASYGEVEDYAVKIAIPTFITDIAPSSGTLAPQGEKTIEVQFSAVGTFSTPGTYNSSVTLITNDPAHANVTIPATMQVIAPGTLSGVVTDAITGNVIPGVSVKAGDYTAMTGDDGSYLLKMEPGNDYIVRFLKIGYSTETMTNIAVTAGSNTQLDVEMYELLVPPACAHAVVLPTDLQANVTWCTPNAPYEMLYDDGTAENFTSWQMPGNYNAVKFTPKGYPAKVVGGRIFVGNGSYPAGGNLMDQPYKLVVFKADGANGLPGTAIDSIESTADRYGWITLTGLNATIESGDFYLAMEQMSQSPNCVPVGIDQTLPKAYKSYSRNVVAGSPWAVSMYQDLMIRAIVEGPLTATDELLSTTEVVPQKMPGTLSMTPAEAIAGVPTIGVQIVPATGFNTTDAVTKYKVTRIANFNPEVPLPGTGVASTTWEITGNSHVDGGTAWAALPAGWYAYGIQAIYGNNATGFGESDVVYTNPVPHKLFADVTVNVQLVCGFVPAVGATVKLTGFEYPYNDYTGVVNNEGNVVFAGMMKGKYEIKVTHGGYTPYIDIVTINANRTIPVVLEDIRYAPRNLFVDEMTLESKWDVPVATALTEDFEGSTFPPTGWSATTQGSVGWQATTNGGSSYFNIPAHTQYAMTNDDSGGSSNNGCCDYLITPSMDLTIAPSYVLKFASFFTGGYGHSAYVEMSTDDGATWTAFHTMEPNPAWANIEIDLSAYSGGSGLSNVKFAFHADDNGEWASGWAIDDVVIESAVTTYQGFQFFLDNSVEGPQLPPTQLEYTIPPTHVNWGQTYVAGVAAIYCSGYSDQALYTFTSRFLYPPRNLQATDYSSETNGVAKLTWEAPETAPTPPPPGGGVKVVLEAHDVWQDGSGYQMLLDKEANTFGTTIPATGPLTNNCTVPANLYEPFEYKIPVDADASCSPANKVFDGSVEINIPAGTYDYVFTNPSPGDRIWVPGGSTSRADNYVFEAGKKYHFLAHREGQGDALTLTISRQGERGQWIVENVINSTPVGGEVRTGAVAVATVNPNSEMAENVASNLRNPSATRAMWDILLNVPVHDTGGEYGIASDGVNMYATRWNSATMYKYDMQGNFIEEFTISGVSNIRDLAYNYDNGHFYGAANATSIFEMDFTTKTLVSTITAPSPVRHIAYSKDLDGGNGGFFIGEWGTLKTIKMNGSLIATSPTNPVGCSGTAYDFNKKLLYLMEDGDGTNPSIIKQMDPTTFTYTGVEHNASDLGITNSEIGGGLDYMKKYNNKPALLGNIQNTKIYVYDLKDGPTPGGVEGIKYRLYRDNVAITPDLPSSPLEYLDSDLTVGQHCWDITAVYEMTSYGYPGIFAESAKEGTPCLTIDLGYNLTFKEDWTTGQFDVNNWTIGPNWIIDGQAGNPLPSAKFKWDTELIDYSSALESFYLNSKNPSASMQYKIKLDFDIKLDDRTATTKEKMNVEVWDGAGWSSVKEFTNNGDFDWTRTSIDITSKAKNRTFKIRFNANGEKSSDIVYWAIDNIKVYFDYVLSPVTNLVATTAPNGKDIVLTWGVPGPPPPPPGVWIHYDDGANADAVGLSAGGDWAVSMKYTPSQLAQYDGRSVSKIKFFPAASCSFKVAVWQGTGLVYEQAVTSPVVGDWNTITLTTPVPINVTKDLYVGYKMIGQAPSTYPAGCDAGPAVQGSGDMLSQDGGAVWQSLYAASGGQLNANWNIQAYLEVVTDAVALQPITVQPISNVNRGTFSKNPNYVANESNLSQRTVRYDDNTDALNGFDVYKSVKAANEFSKIGSTTATVTTYTDANVTPNGCYDYYVIAVYQEGNSAPSNIDDACVNVGVETNVNEVKVYPNPATTYVNIDITKEVSNVKVYNALGSVIAEKEVKGLSHFTLNTSNYAAGAYSVKFTTANGETFSRKFVVIK